MQSHIIILLHLYSDCVYMHQIIMIITELLYLMHSHYAVDSVPTPSFPPHGDDPNLLTWEWALIAIGNLVLPSFLLLLLSQVLF